RWTGSTDRKGKHQYAGFGSSWIGNPGLVLPTATSITMLFGSLKKNDARPPASWTSTPALVSLDFHSCQSSRLGTWKQMWSSERPLLGMVAGSGSGSSASGNSKNANTTFGAMVMK